MAEEQRQRISDTTKVALEAAKKRGVELGKNGKALSALNRQAAEDFANGLCPVLRRLRNRGIVSVRAVSKELNKKGVPTFRTGGKWHPSTVYVLMNRLNKQDHLNNKTKSTAMLTTTTNDILFDDAAILENRLGKNNWHLTAENISPDCNCSGYTSTNDEEELSAARIAARNTSRYSDCTNN